MSLLFLILACWLLWKLGIIAFKFIGWIFILLFIGFFIHILLWPAIIIAAVLCGYGLFTN